MNGMTFLGQIHPFQHAYAIIHCEIVIHLLVNLIKLDKFAILVISGAN